MRKSTRLLAIFLAVLMAVSVFPVSAFAADYIVEAVDTSELVMETKFLYPGTDKAWGTKSRDTYVESPVFYTEIPATVNGEPTTLVVDKEWTCFDEEGDETEFDGTAVDTTYYFEPVLPAGYEWGDDVEVPRIKVEIIDGAIIYNVSSSAGVSTAHTEPIPIVFKDAGNIYDATGCNKMATANYYFAAGLIKYATGATKQQLTTPAYDTKITATGTIDKIIVGGGLNLPLDGSTYVNFVDATSSITVFGGAMARSANLSTTVSGDTHITFVDSAATSIYGGGNTVSNTGSDATVAGNAYIDVSGKVAVNNIFAGGNSLKTNSKSGVKGTAYINIHDLEAGSSIGKVTRFGNTEANGAAALEVDLDDTSKLLLAEGVIEGVSTTGVTDSKVTVRINGEKFVGVVDDDDLTGIDDVVVKDDVLPTQFGGISGFTWDKNTQTVGMNQKFTLTAPDGYFFEDLSKTREFTITVNAGFVAVTGVTLDKDNVSLDVGAEIELTATVEPENATDKTVAWSSNDEGVAKVVDGVVTAMGEGTVTITATAGGYSDTCVVTVTKAAVITAVDTEGLVLNTTLPYGSGVEATAEPKFYDTLSVTVNSEETNLSGFTWKCDNYNGTETGTYSFTAVAPSGYTWFGGAQAPVITVEVVEASYNTSGGRVGITTANGKPLHMIFKPDSEGTYSIFDATGYNIIRKNYSVGARYVAAAHSSSTFKDAAGYKSSGDTKITVQDAVATAVLGAGHAVVHEGDTYVYVINSTVQLNTSTDWDGCVFGGGYYKATLTGDSHVYIVDSTIGKGVYGGGTNSYGTITGDAYIDISGLVSIPEVNGGNQKSTAVAGTAYVTIHDLKEGSVIKKITRGTTSKLVVNITSSADVSAESLLKNVENYDSDPNTTVYLDGKLVQKVTKVEMPAQQVYSVAIGTQIDGIGLPTTLTATVNGQTSAINNVSWVCANYDAATAGKYTFTPVVTDSADTVYNMEESNIDDVSVVVRVLTGNPIQQITEFAPIDAISVSLRTTEEQLVLPETVTATVNGQQKQVEVDRWICNTVYDGSVYGAEYTYTATVSGEYSHSVAAPTVVVKITSAKITQIYLPKTQTTFPLGTVETPTFYDTLAVKLDNGTVMDVSGFEWTVKDYNKDTLGTYTATISAVPANYEFAANLTLPSISVTVARQKLDIFTLDTMAYLYGMPVVIDGTSSATYIYDITGCNKISQTNIAGKSVGLGGPQNTAALKTTYVEVRGGSIATLYGGSRHNGKVTDTTYIYVFGGTISAVYGGGTGGTSATTRAETGNAYIYVENAKITKRICGAGYKGRVSGDSTIIVKNATVNAIYSSSNYTKTIATVDGKMTIKLLDGANVTSVLGSGTIAPTNEVEIYLSKNAAITSELDATGNSYVKLDTKIFYETGFDLSKVHAEEPNVKLYEGHFLDDRETFVTDREIKIVRNAGLVRGNVYVDYGTKLEDIGLPTTFEGEIDGELQTVEGLTYTSKKTYDGNTPGTYDFVLNVPDGYHLPFFTVKNAGTVKVIVTEPNQGGNITAIQSEDPNHKFANGTAIENIGLPSAYTATVSGVSKTVPVKNWIVKNEYGSEVTYDRYTAETYVFTPVFGSEYTVSAQLPTYTVTISPYKLFSTSNTRYINGIPAVIESVDATTRIADKNNNYLGRAGTYTTVYGGSNKEVLESTDVTLKSGTINSLYGGSDYVDVTGNVNLVVNGGTVTYVYGGCRQAASESINVVINGGTHSYLWCNYGGSVEKGVNYEINGGTITNLYAGARGTGYINGVTQEADEVLAQTTIKDKGPIVVEKGELISAVVNVNGGTISNIYGAGYVANSDIYGSVKLYLNNGTANTIYGGGFLEEAITLGNVYIVVADSFDCDTIYANASGKIHGTAYVVVPSTFNRFDILGWEEEDVDDDMSGDSSGDAEDEGSTADVETEVIVSGGHYKAGVPVRIAVSGSTQNVYARGIPIKIVGETSSSSDDEDEEVENVVVTTYIWYFDENYDAATETPETFSYETYVDRNGNPLVLTGVWRKINTAIKSSAVIYGGGRQGTSDIHPSTYVEFNGGNIATLYGGGRNNTVGAANVVLDAQGTHSISGDIYGGGTNTVNVVTNKTYVKMLNGSYNRIVAGGNEISNNGTQVDVFGGSVTYIYMGTIISDTITAGTTKLTLENCTVESIYSGGVGTGTITTGAAYIDINENVTITGSIYPKGSGIRADGVESGPVKTWAYVNLNDSDSVSSQFKKIKYKKSQAPYIYVNGVLLGELPETSVASYELADKKVEVTTAESSDFRGNRTMIFLNGIPTVIAGDGNGRSYLYQAKTKDGTLNAYQKNEDGTFKYDENGDRISNIVRDQVTGQAVKGPKLVDVDVIDCVVYGGANGKSVEDVYVEFHNGGAMWVFYGGCRGGNTGYDAQGNEVGLLEVRQFDGGAFDLTYIGNVLGYDASGDQTVNVKVTRSVFLGLGGGTRLGGYGGLHGTRGSEEKFLNGYYNKAGDTFTYTDAVDGQEYEITGTWEDYNLDVTKQDYADYYESTNAYFNGENNTEFLQSDYFVDPYDDHYTHYCLFTGMASGYEYLSSVSSTLYAPELNRTFGNTYFRQSAYELKYDPQLDWFVEDYSDPIAQFASKGPVYGGSTSGLSYGDLRCDMEGIMSQEIQPLGKRSSGGRNYGHVYINLYETDTYHTLHNALYKNIKDKSEPNVTINQNFYPRWSFTSAWALDADPEMAKFAINKGYVDVNDPKDVRVSMLAAQDAAKLLNYYYTGSYDEYITSANAPQTQGYQDVWDASNDLGKLVIRFFEGRKPAQDGAERFLINNATKFGDSQFITFPNGETMLIDMGQTESGTLINSIRYVLEQLKAQGKGDGKTIDYFVVSHFHNDHDSNAVAVLRAFDVKNVVRNPLNVAGGLRRTWLTVVDTMNAKRAAEGKELIKELILSRGDKIVIGEGDEQVVIDILNPGDHSYKTYTLAEAIRQTDKGSTSFHNPCALGMKFTFQGQTYFTAGDIKEDAELSMVRTYGKEFMNFDVMKLSHHGFATSNTWGFMSAVDPEVCIQPINATYHAWTSVPSYLVNNNTGGYGENVFTIGIAGDIKVALDGDNIVSTTQYKERAFDRNTSKYQTLDANYSGLLDEVENTMDALTVVSDGATAPYGTAYMWNSHANYVEGQLEELSKRYYSGTMSTAMLEDYTSKLTTLLDFIDDATMYGGSDTTPDVEVPGTPGEDVGGNDTTTPGTSGGIIGDIGGGDAGSGIGGGAGGAAPGGAIVGPAGPSVDDGETTDPVTPDDNRRFIDVAETDWFNKAVNYVADNNYFQGVSENEFDPDGKMTRAMLVTVIGRIAKADVSQAKS
ncbi:MAG: Ig-like domain-containing protein, partial [Clostridia bacterium]|nr:Ig-like domain-containing protein [Clostridia bacterium]